MTFKEHFINEFSERVFNVDPYNAPLDEIQEATASIFKDCQLTPDAMDYILNTVEWLAELIEN